MEQYLNKHFFGKGEAAKTIICASEDPVACKKIEYLRVYHSAHGICGDKHLRFSLFWNGSCYPIGGFSDSEHYQPDFILFQIK